MNANENGHQQIHFKNDHVQLLDLDFRCIHSLSRFTSKFEMYVVRVYLELGMCVLFTNPVNSRT